MRATSFPHKYYNSKMNKNYEVQQRIPCKHQVAWWNKTPEGMPFTMDWANNIKQNIHKRSILVYYFIKHFSNTVKFFTMIPRSNIALSSSWNSDISSYNVTASLSELYDIFFIPFMLSSIFSSSSVSWPSPTLQHENISDFRATRLSPFYMNQSHITTFKIITTYVYFVHRKSWESLVLS